MNGYFSIGDWIVILVYMGGIIGLGVWFGAEAKIKDPGLFLIAPAILGVAGPVGVYFLGRPFSEPVLLNIAAAYEAATHHRTPPPAFGPVATPTMAATQ